MNIGTIGSVKLILLYNTYLFLIYFWHYFRHLIKVLLYFFKLFKDVFRLLLEIKFIVNYTTLFLFVGSSLFSIGYPLFPLAIFPDAYFHSTVCGLDNALPMLLAFAPHAFIDFAVLLFEDTISMHFIIQKLTLILATIGPCLDADALHATHRPLAKVFTSICPFVTADATHGVILPFAVVGVSLGPHLLSCTALLAILKVTFEF